VVEVRIGTSRRTQSKIRRAGAAQPLPRPSRPEQQTVDGRRAHREHQHSLDHTKPQSACRSAWEEVSRSSPRAACRTPDGMLPMARSEHYLIASYLRPRWRAANVQCSPRPTAPHALDVEFKSIHCSRCLLRQLVDRHCYDRFDCPVVGGLCQTGGHYERLLSTSIVLFPRLDVADLAKIIDAVNIVHGRVRAVYFFAAAPCVHECMCSVAAFGDAPKEHEPIRMANHLRCC
jgi:hypothetical protein